MNQYQCLLILYEFRNARHGLMLNVCCTKLNGSLSRTAAMSFTLQYQKTKKHFSERDQFKGLCCIFHLGGTAFKHCINVCCDVDKVSFKMWVITSFEQIYCFKAFILVWEARIWRGFVSKRTAWNGWTKRWPICCLLLSVTICSADPLHFMLKHPLSKSKGVLHHICCERRRCSYCLTFSTEIVTSFMYKHGM